MEYIRFYDTNSQGTASVGQENFRFRINDIHSLWLLQKGYLLFEFTVKSVDAGGADVADEPVAVEYLGKHIRRAILNLGTTQIEGKEQYVYRDAEVETMTWSKQYAETVGSLAFYHPDDLLTSSAGHKINKTRAVYSSKTAIALADLTLEPDPFFVPGTHENMVYAHTNTGGTSYGMLPLVHVFNFVKAYDRIIRGIDIEIMIDLAPLAVRCILGGKKTDGSATTGASVKYTHVGAGVSLYLPRMLPPASIMADLNMKYARGLKATVPWEKSQVYQHALPVGAASVGSWYPASNVAKPLYGYFFIRNQSTETNFKQRLHRRAQMITQIQVMVNGRAVPTEQLKMESANNGTDILQRNFTQYARQFYDLVHSDGQSAFQRGHPVGHLTALNLMDNSMIAIDFRQMGDDLIAKTSDIQVNYTIDNGAANIAAASYLYAVIYSHAVTELELSEQRSIAYIGN